MIGGFVQDSWRPTSRLTFNLGVRYDHQEGTVPAQGQDRTPVVYKASPTIRGSMSLHRP